MHTLFEGLLLIGVLGLLAIVAILWYAVRTHKTVNELKAKALAEIESGVIKLKSK